MQFGLTWQYLLEASPSGELKTQTRRLVKAAHGGLVGGDGVALLERLAVNETPIEYEAVVVPNDEGGVKRTLWHQGHEYSVQPGRGKPTIWWRQGHIGVEYAHVALKDGQTYWESCDGDKKELSAYGFTPLRVRITNIRRQDVRRISDEDVKAEGFSTPLDFLSTWCQMHGTEHYDAWALTFGVVR